MDQDSASLDRLHDIVVPGPVSWWPLAPGWWMVLIAITGAASHLGFRYWKRWRANAYRRAGLAAIKAASSSLEINQVLRRVALAIMPREQVVELRGDQWTRWLAEQVDFAVPPELEEALTTSPYSGTKPTEASESLHRFAIDWILHHRRPC